MNTLTKVLAGTAIGAAVIAGYRYFRALKKAKDYLLAIPQVKLHSLSLTGLVIRIDVTLKNPTTANFKIKFPFVEIKYKNAVIGTSQVINKDISIPKYGEATIEQIMIQIPLTSVFSVAISLVKALKNKEPVKVSATVKTIINLGWTKLDYEDTQELPIKT